MPDKYVNIKVRESEPFIFESFRFYPVDSAQGIFAIGGRLQEAVANDEGIDPNTYIEKNLLFNAQAWGEEMAKQWAKGKNYTPRQNQFGLVRSQSMARFKGKAEPVRILAGWNFRIEDEEQRIISGYASTAVVDSYETIFDPQAFARSVNRWKENPERGPLLRYMHNRQMFPIGKPLAMRIDDNGLFTKAQFLRKISLAEDVWQLVLQRVLNGLSIGFWPRAFMEIDERLWLFTDLDLREWSVVDTPANPETWIKDVRAESYCVRIANNEGGGRTMPDVRIEAPKTFEEMSELFRGRFEQWDKDKREVFDGQKKFQGEIREQIEKAMGDFKKLSDEYYAAKMPKPKTINLANPDEAARTGLASGKPPISEVLDLQITNPRTDRDHKILRLQNLNDTLYLGSHFGQARQNLKNIRWSGYQGMRFWQEYQMLASELAAAPSKSDLGRALDTETAGEGLEFIPTLFSAQLHELLRLQFLVPGLVDDFAMPSDNWKFPIEGVDTEAKLVGETKTKQTALTSDEETPGTGNVVFDAKKFRALIAVSSEALEDSVINLGEYIRRKEATSMIKAIEAADISGDDSATHMDSDTQAAAATNARKAWKGYRKHGLSNATDFGNVVVSSALILSLLRSMGKYAVRPIDLTFVVPVLVYFEMLALSEVKTMDVFGSMATVVNGVLQKLFGTDIVISGEYREDLNATGVYDGITTTRTSMLCVHKPSFAHGTRRQVTLETWRLSEYDQIEFIAFLRKAFVKFPAVAVGNSPVALAYNIAKA
ncbi:MAG: phage major capsid protein [candidate division Zixibacteria bacterium]|nr:phage major capsid protein [candidate division Zixibacteria bacterium]